jgi:hypothetical protein
MYLTKPCLTDSFYYPAFWTILARANTHFSFTIVASLRSVPSDAMPCTILLSFRGGLIHSTGGYAYTEALCLFSGTMSEYIEQPVIPKKQGLSHWQPGYINTIDSTWIKPKTLITGKYWLCWLSPFRCGSYFRVAVSCWKPGLVGFILPLDRWGRTIGLVVTHYLYPVRCIS